MTDQAYPDALPGGYRLHWYELEQVLGQGGFGITYLARDTNLDRRVAIKEYLPAEIARRRSDAAAQPRTEAQSERYHWGLERFLAEARTLARFDHPNIVRVISVFESNNTAYMVMRFEEGESLARLLERCGTLTERQLTDCLLPILGGLQLVHASGYIHRDIKPDNIYLRQDGSAVLLDFGSARQAFGSAKTMTVLVAPGYAPLEQYYSDGATQGPWTDIYGLGATCYRAITGRAPLDAIVRAKGVLGSAREVLPPATELGRGRYSERLLAAVDHALRLSERERPQAIADWRRELEGAAAPAPVVASEPVAVAPPAVVAPRSRPTTLAWAAATAAALAGIAVLFFAVREPGSAPATTTRATPLPPPAPAPSRVAMPEVAQVQIQAAAPLPTPAPSAAPPSVTAPPRTTPVPRAERVAVAPAPSPVQPPPRPTAESAARPPAAESSSTSTGSETGAANPLPAPPAAALLAAVASTQAAAPARDRPPADNGRKEQLDAAEAALRRGDRSGAVKLLTPWANAGVLRAQVLLAGAQESRSAGDGSDFQAYVWYSLATRGGEAAASALRNRVAARLQPAEIRQADQAVERWRPGPEPTTAPSSHP